MEMSMKKCLLGKAAILQSFSKFFTYNSVKGLRMKCLV